MKDSEIFTVIVADDEPELREAVCQLIPWDKIGFRLIGSAGNGLDTLQMVEQLQPDFLLTDIRMPFISGTELARQVREVQPMIQVAFLSGYDDFAYARDAIDNNVIAYLLKPISNAELTESLAEIHQKMVKRYNDFYDDDESENLLLSVAALLMNPFESMPDDAVLRLYLEKAGFPTTEGTEFAALVTMPDPDSDDPVRRSSIRTVDKIMRNAYQSCSVPAGNCILTLLAGDSGLDRLDDLLDTLLQVFRRIVSPRSGIGVSRIFSAPGSASLAVREAYQALMRAEGSGIYRTLQQMSGGRDPAAADGVGMLCSQALEMIEKDYMQENISLRSVSEQLHISPNYLSANMKKYTGDTFINLLIRKRMEVARELLRDDSTKIGAIAAMCGYSDQHYFSYCFKKYYGVSPAVMRREGLKEK